MGGGNPVKKVTKVVTKATDQVGNATETAVKQGRDEAFRNLGSDGQKYAGRASDLFVENPLKRMGSASEDLHKGNIGDAARTTATLGVASAGDVVGLMKKQVPDLPALPVDDPSKTGPVGDPVAEAEAAAKALKEDANMQEQLAGSRKRGRASTILTGPQGLSGSNAYSSKKTLLGA